MKREEIAAALVRYTGLSADIVDKANLRISPSTFEAALLENERKVIGRFDGRLTGYDPRPLDRQPAFDPSLDAYRGTYGGYVQRVRPPRAEIRIRPELPSAQRP